MKRSAVTLALAAVGLGLAAIPARADVTALVGTTVAGGARPTIAVSYGQWLDRFGGIELEVATAVGSGTLTSPTVGTFSAGFIVQTTPMTRGVRFYGNGGVALVDEEGGGKSAGEVVGPFVGGGMNVPINGPLKLRLDYRMFILGDTPDASRDFVVRRHPQRFSAGLTVAF